MQKKKLVVVVATLALLAVVALGGTALADEAPSTTTGPLALPQVFLDKLAASLGIERGTLDAAIQDAAGQTVDEAAAQGRITSEQADQLKSRMQEGTAPFWGPRGGGRGHMRGWGAGNGAAGAGFSGCPYWNTGVQAQQLN